MAVYVLGALPSSMGLAAARSSSRAAAFRTFAKPAAAILAPPPPSPLPMVKPIPGAAPPPGGFRVVASLATGQRTRAAQPTITAAPPAETVTPEVRQAIYSAMVPGGVITPEPSKARTEAFRQAVAGPQSGGPAYVQPPPVVTTSDGGAPYTPPAGSGAASGTGGGTYSFPPLGADVSGGPPGPGPVLTRAGVPPSEPLTGSPVFIAAVAGLLLIGGYIMTRNGAR